MCTKLTFDFFKVIQPKHFVFFLIRACEYFFPQSASGGSNKFVYILILLIL